MKHVLFMAACATAIVVGGCAGSADDAGGAQGNDALSGAATPKLTPVRALDNTKLENVAKVFTAGEDFPGGATFSLDRLEYEPDVDSLEDDLESAAEACGTLEGEKRIECMGTFIENARTERFVAMVKAHDEGLFAVVETKATLPSPPPTGTALATAKAKSITGRGLRHLALNPTADFVESPMSSAVMGSLLVDGSIALRLFEGIDPKSETRHLFLLDESTHQLLDLKLTDD